MGGISGGYGGGYGGYGQYGGAMGGASLASPNPRAASRDSSDDLSSTYLHADVATAGVCRSDVFITGHLGTLPSAPWCIAVSSALNPPGHGGPARKLMDESL